MKTRIELILTGRHTYAGIAFDRPAVGRQPRLASFYGEILLLIDERDGPISVSPV